MLLLSRRVSERIVIGGNIIITVVSIQGNQVRFGVEAPRDVIVDRQEIHERRLADINGAQK
jgi:carbon storage regulator